MKKFFISLAAFFVFTFAFNCCAGPSSLHISDWSELKIGGVLPELAAENVEVIDNTESELCLKVLEFSQDNFVEYSSLCAESGFDVNRKDGDSYFYADSANGYHLSVNLSADGSMKIYVNYSKPVFSFAYNNSSETSVNDVTDARNEPKDTHGLQEQKNQTADSNILSENLGDADEHIDAVISNADDNDNGTEMVWIPTNGGKKYHSRAGCSGMKNPTQISKENAVVKGYTPCKRCY